MKTKLILFILLIAPVLIQGQDLSNKDKALISTKVDTLLTSFMTKGSLTKPGKIKMDDKTTSEFKKLFTLDAQIFDDINAEFNQDLSGYPYVLMTKTRNEYIEDLVFEFENGLMINNKRINVSYEELDKGIVKAAIERDISGITKSRSYHFFNHDTILVTIAVGADKSVKIKSIEALGNPQVKIKNDDDLDGVVDATDECRKQRGLIALRGCPDSDGDGIADKNDECPLVAGTKENGGCPASTFAYSYVLSGSIGYQFNNNSIKTPELDDLAYNSLDKNRSNTGEVSAPGYKGSLTLSGNIAYYFGKKKITGIREFHSDFQQQITRQFTTLVDPVMSLNPMMGLTITGV
ncbi:MAG: thrombospondin type 3 repeat-containing protein [Bacteroidetes bacterium]|nr:thrombospondin type 3 repeat-containing protein [Bacteroidota bacterium]